MQLQDIPSFSNLQAFTGHVYLAQPRHCPTTMEVQQPRTAKKTW